MKWTGLIAALSLALAADAQASGQHGVIGHYTARLSARDHFSSSGNRILTVAGIIRQDRANVHRFGLVDDEDQSDAFFDSAEHRAILERLIARGRIAPGVSSAILNGEPLIHVDIYDGYIIVTVI